jgi:hypothetical protein
MFLGTLFALCLVSVPLCGGRLGALAEVRLRANWLIGLALATQVVIISILPGGAQWIHQTAHLGSYVIAGAYLWLNRRVPGLLLAGAGGLANFLAIAANAGVMPASAAALRTAGLDGEAGHFQNSAAVDDARLAFLGDVFAVPESWPVHNVFSVGDVLLVLGALVGLHVFCGTRPARALGHHPVAVRQVEVLDTGTARALVRVHAVPHRGMETGDLVVDDGTTVERLAPLPGSTRANGYAVPIEKLEAPRTRLALALPNRAVVALER